MLISAFNRRLCATAGRVACLPSPGLPYWIQRKREEALRWLGQMTEEKLASLTPGYSLVVNTPLLRGLQISPALGDEKSRRYSLTQFLRSLDHPDMDPLREEPEFRSLREQVEAQLAEG